MRKAKAPSGPKCTSTVNTMKCVLKGEHEEHRNTEKTSGQHMRWSVLGDGRIKVQPHQGSKKQGDGWFEDQPEAAPPHKPEAYAAALAAMDEECADELDDLNATRVGPSKPAVCGVRLAKVGTCKLFDGHAGDHFTESNGTACSWDRDGDNSWEVCGERLALAHGDKGPTKLPKETHTICQRPGEHDGTHRGLGHIGNHLDEWKGNGPGCTSHPKTKIDTVAELLGRGRLDQDDEPDVEEPAREIEQQAEAVDPEPKTPGFQQEPAPKPGDTRTKEGGKKERWCWGPEGWGWRDYKAAGKGCAGCGRHKVECLCKQMKAAELRELAKPEPVEAMGLRLTDECAKCGRELGEHDGKRCPKPAKAAKPGTAPTSDALPPASDLRILGYRRHPAAAEWPMMEAEEFEGLLASIRERGLEEGGEITLVTVDGETWILDGSNRGLAIEILRLQPRFVQYDGPTDMPSLRSWVDARNKHRRHLSKSVLAMIAASEDRLCRGNPGDRETGRSAGLKSQAERAKEKNVSARLVRKAETVKDNATPAIVQAVMSGKMALEAAELATKLPEAKQNELAERALAKRDGTAEVRRGNVQSLVRQEEKRAIVRKINEGRVAPMPGGLFGVIYGDYPWLFENSDQHEGSRGHMPYPPMSIEQIVAHAIEAAKRAAENCILALWTTNAHILEVKPVIAAYGAVHRTTFTWPKVKAGVGTWGRGQTEQLLIASIGEPVHTLNEVSTLLPAWKPEHPGEHSSKPKEVAELLLKHCAGPHLELFARGPREGFVSWGAEADKFATEAA